MKQKGFLLTEKMVFVVDDSEITLLMAKNILKDRYRVMTLDSAEKLFSILLKIRPDLILLDIEMPGDDGFKVLKHLKESKKNKNIPVIFLTSGGTTPNVAKAAVLGACDFIVKPFDPIVLCEKVEKFIRKPVPKRKGYFNKE